MRPKKITSIRVDVKHHKSTIMIRIHSGKAMKSGKKETNCNFKVFSEEDPGFSLRGGGGGGARKRLKENLPQAFMQIE